MTLAEKLRIKATLGVIAAQEGCSVAHIRKEIQASIDDAWENTGTPGNLQAQLSWQRLFPGGKKPTVEEFIAAASRSLQK